MVLNGLVPPLDGSDGDVGVRVPEFYMCVKDTGTKYYGKYVRIIQIINYAKYFRINFIRNGKAYCADSRDKTLFYSIHRFNHFPINFKIIKYDWRIYAKNRKEKVKLKT